MVLGRPDPPPLVAPYCAIPRDYLSDTTLLRALGVFGVSTWPIGCDTPSPFSERFPLGEHARRRCDTPLQKGYLSDTCAIPSEFKQGNKRAIPPSAILSRKGIARYGGGVSHWAAKSRYESPLSQNPPLGDVDSGITLHIKFSGGGHALSCTQAYLKDLPCV